MLLTDADKKRVAEAISDVEKHTDAELVTVLATRADDYRYVSLLWAAVLSLLAPALLWLAPAWLTTADIIVGQWILFVLLAILFRIPAIMMRLLPRAVKQWRAANLARAQFLNNNLHHTRGNTGVLIFVAEAERYVEILADQGINQHVAVDEWQSIIDTFTAQVRAGETLNGFLQCIESCGEILARHVPATSAKNELPNHLIEINP